MSNYNFLDFTKEFHPSIWDEFYRFKRKNIYPAIDSKIKVIGFIKWGILLGTEMYVVSYRYTDDEAYIELSDDIQGDVKCRCNADSWWRNLKIINEPEVE